MFAGKRLVALTWAAAVVMASSGCSRSRELPSVRIVVQELETPAAADSGEAHLTPTGDGRVLLSWIEREGERGHALRYAARGQGQPWSAATTVARGTDWFVNWADFPSLAPLPDGTLYAHWLAKSGPDPYSYDVRVARSVDGGAHWSGAVAPHRDGTRTEHGFASLTPWSSKEMGIVWLDGRNSGGRGHDGHGAGQAAMSLMHTTIDRDGLLGAETLLDGRVCDCCQTDAAVTHAGTVVVYRDRSQKEVRDIAVVRYTGGRWTEPRTLADDGWEIHGCPVNGPVIAAAGSRVAVAWFTAAAEKPIVKTAFSADSGATFGAPVVVDDGRPLGRVDIVLLDDGSALVSWLEQAEPGARVRVRRIASNARSDEPVTVAESSGARSSGFPRMARLNGEVVIAWRDAGDPPRVRTALLTTEPR
jgi:hypothetical protein